MALNDQQIVDILVEGSYITEADRSSASKTTKKLGQGIIDTLLDEGFVTNDLIGQAIAEHFGLPFLNFAVKPPSKEVVVLIPEDVAKKEHLIAVAVKGQTVTVATDDPTRKDLDTTVAAVFPGKKVKIGYALPEAITDALRMYQRALAARFTDILKRGGSTAPQIIEEIIKDAIGFRASDIHLEPQGQEVVVRFRIDGVLQEVGRIPKIAFETILNRLKV